MRIINISNDIQSQRSNAMPHKKHETQAEKTEKKARKTKRSQSKAV